MSLLTSAGYYKVYQAAPSNGELLAKFARGFVYERSQASSDPDSRRIAWARFGGAVLDHCKLQKGGLERKINKFWVDYGIVKLEASYCDVAVSSKPTISASKRQVVEQPMYMQQVLSIAEGIIKVDVQLQQKRDVSLKNEGLSSAYSGLFTELEELKKELEHLKNSLDATPRDIDCKELEVQAIMKILAKEKRDALEDDAKLLIAQQAFMDKAIKYIQREGKASMVPTPPATASTLKPVAFVGGSCAACGKLLSANHMEGVFLFTCQHKYHPFCFVVLCVTKTKDGSSCHHSYDEDHSDLFDSFQMKGTASDDIANVLQGMAKLTTESSPILVLGEDHGKDKIVDPASKPSTDNPKESEATDYMDDPKLGETLRFMVAELKKKRKRELEEGPANPNRIKIPVVSYPSSKSLDDSDTPINIDRVPPIYRSLGRAFACKDASRPAIVLDLNNVLMITHRKSINPLPPDVSSLYFYVIEDKEDRDITYYAFGKYSTLLLDDSSYKSHLNEKGTYVVLPGIEQQSDEQWNGFLKNDVLQFLYTWVDAKKEDRFKIVKECKFDVSEFAEHRRDMLFIKKNLEGGGTIYPLRNSGLHEKREPENPGSAAGDPGSASGSPCKHGHPRPQYKRLGTQGRK
ncbi:hypothetical protein L7F22_008447 [Adiantum nelumboides]|nr:hypothetical protein [Adiantum nelumboides]